MTYRILVVCTGNICRSPMGEIVLHDKLAAAGITDVEVGSAGVSAEESGHPIDRRAENVLQNAGYRVPGFHNAHRATRRELREADLVLAMTVGHARALYRMMKEAGADTSKIHLWREFDGTINPAPNGAFGEGGPLEGQEKARSRPGYDFYTSDGVLDVLDPWYGDQGGFYGTLGVVERGADGIIAWIPKN
ncbi:MAG: low molecular weight phosphotyrosine protein phosphatase [Actinomycetaceae bacterium]|nr:low molecular weight phosphotyrosine protein phosphatase [Actinomycetaceae bacterium]